MRRCSQRCSWRFHLEPASPTGLAICCWRLARVRPLLVVRCLYRATEVFVVTQSAASIEGQSGSHTVHLQFDDDQEVAQQWTDSVTGRSLVPENYRKTGELKATVVADRENRITLEMKR